MSASFPLRLGFLSFVSYLHLADPARRESGAEAALQDGLDLFRHAEGIGLDGGWVRVRHFERGLTAPFVLLAAAAQATTRIRLGTAVVPIAHEDAVSLAEQAATLDILSRGRLELGVSTGFGRAGTPLATAVAHAHGYAPDVDTGARARIVLDTFLRAIAGEELAETDRDLKLQFTNTGEGLRVYPHSPRLRERIWYGSGTESSAVRAAARGLNLQVSTINTEPSAAGVPAQQATFLRRYADGVDPSALSLPAPRDREVSVSRYVLPYTTQEERRIFLEAAEHHIPGVSERFGQGWVFGSVDQVIEQLSRDAALVEGRRHFPTTLLLNLPSFLTPEWTRRVVDIAATQVAPALGWEPRAAG